MSSINWKNIGANISSVTSLLTATGMNSTSATSLASQIGALFSTSASSNPNKAEEEAICAQIMASADNPDIAKQLELKLAIEPGLPPAALIVVKQMMQPGANTIQLGLEIQQLLNQS